MTAPCPECDECNEVKMALLNAVNMLKCTMSPTFEVGGKHMYACPVCGKWVESEYNNCCVGEFVRRWKENPKYKVAII